MGITATPSSQAAWPIWGCGAHMMGFNKFIRNLLRTQRTLPAPKLWQGNCRQWALFPKMPQQEIELMLDPD